MKRGPGASSNGFARSARAEESTPRLRTLEEKEAAYAQARERIYGKSDVDGAASLTIDQAVGRAEDEDFDPVPRNPYGISSQGLLYEPNLPGQMYSSGHLGEPPDPHMANNPLFGYAPNGMPYGYPPVIPEMGTYTSPAANYVNPQLAYPGFPVGQAPYPGVWIQAEPWQQAQMMPIPLPNQQVSMPQWIYGAPPPMQQAPMMPPPGTAYVGYAPYPYHPAIYPPIMQPVPTRPQPPRSSASSSMSSRSYQDFSRPHSRGSTTSTRSAASSVRVGKMYPANPGPYRQNTMKAPSLGGMTTLTEMDRRRSGRGHSPVSCASNRTESHSYE